VNRLCDEVRHSKNLSIDLKIGNLANQLSSSTSLSLYRVAQEALHNVIKHSQAKNVQVELSSDDGQILLRIIDDGLGFDLSHEVAGLGLASMRQRVQAVGGSIDISSSLKRGTRIEVRVPIQKDDGRYTV
jgi:signal transduction histidine kinase